MIEAKQIKPGLLVWWAVSTDRRDWSCPAVVTEVKRGKSFRVMSFDDFKVTDPLRMEAVPGGDGTCRDEMRVCTIDEVEEFIDKQRDAHLARVEKARTELAARERELTAYVSKANSALADLKYKKAA